LSGEQIEKLLAVIPSTPVGLRDRAIVLTLTFTGRRRTEVISMTADSISVEDRIFYTYKGKGGKTGKRELPVPASNAIKNWLAVVGRRLETMEPNQSLWPDIRTDRGITSGTFYTNLRRYLKTGGLPAGNVHIFRHSAAKLRRDAGCCDRESLPLRRSKQPGSYDNYLRRLEGQEDKTGKPSQQQSASDSNFDSNRGGQS
jgi:site-specific recombinase XerD